MWWHQHQHHLAGRTGSESRNRWNLQKELFELPLVVAMLMLTVVRLLSPGKERSIDIMKTLLGKNSCGTLSFESSVEKSRAQWTWYVSKRWWFAALWCGIYPVAWHISRTLPGLYLWGISRRGIFTTSEIVVYFLRTNISCFYLLHINVFII
jgi:hypothetical protein